MSFRSHTPYRHAGIGIPKAQSGFVCDGLTYYAIMSLYPTQFAGLTSFLTSQNGVSKRT